MGVHILNIYNNIIIHKAILTYYSITAFTFAGPLNVTLFPTKSAPIIYKVGISRGKLKGETTATGPNGQRYA